LPSVECSVPIFHVVGFSVGGFFVIRLAVIGFSISDLLVLERGFSILGRGLSVLERGFSVIGLLVLWRKVSVSGLPVPGSSHSIMEDVASFFGKYIFIQIACAIVVDPFE
jgi:hypothetical protein